MSDGILEEQEEERLAHAVLRQRHRVERAGAKKGRQPGLMSMLENLELLRGMPREVIRLFRNGDLKVGQCSEFTVSQQPYPGAPFTGLHPLFACTRQPYLEDTPHMPTLPVCFQIYARGELLWDGETERQPGMLVVIWGMVRCVLEVDGQDVNFYQGSGGVLGLMASVVGTHVPGIVAKAAYAEGNAMGRGPVMLHISW